MAKIVYHFTVVTKTYPFQLYSFFDSYSVSVTTFSAIVPCETEKEKTIFLFSK